MLIIIQQVTNYLWQAALALCFVVFARLGKGIDSDLENRIYSLVYFILQVFLHIDLTA